MFKLINQTQNWLERLKEKIMAHESVIVARKEAEARYDGSFAYQGG